VICKVINNIQIVS